MFAFLSYALLGALICSLVGLSADSLSRLLIPLVFSFTGGAILAVQDKLDERKMKLALCSIFGLGGGGLVCLYSALVVTEHRFLTPKQYRAMEITKLAKPADGKYLRSDEVSKLRMIASRLDNDLISKSDAAKAILESMPDDE